MAWVYSYGKLKGYRTEIAMKSLTIILTVIGYALALGYVLLLVVPAYHCMTGGCRGPGEGDILFPAFILGPIGGIFLLVALSDSVRQIKKKNEWSWFFWVLAAVFAAVLAIVVCAFVYAVVANTFHLV